MGINKTGSVIDALDHRESILWVIPRISLGYNLQQRLDATGKFDFRNYKKFSKKDEDKISDAKQLICCVLSLYKTHDAFYDTIVLDEVETLLMLWKGDIGQDYFDKNWSRFMEVLRSAKKVYVMDAFMGEKTINFLKSVDANRVPRVITGLVPPDERRIITYSCRTGWTSKISDELRSGKKLFIFYPFKTGHGDHHSMQKFREILSKDSGISVNDILWYNADSPDSVKKTLLNVNQVWSEKPCVICNSCITVGVNFDDLHFDSVFAMWEPFVSQRDFFQNMYRCRKLKTNEVHLLSENPRLMFKPWIHAESKDPAYASLLRDLALEENSKGSMDVFKLFAKQSGFVFCGQGQEVSDAIKERIKKIADETDCIFMWNKIPRMTWTEYEDAKHQIINSCTESVDTVVRVHKYDFIQLFHPDTENRIMGELWDTHKFQLFDAIVSQECGGQRPADILIRDLFSQNNCKYFLPEDPKWTYKLEDVRKVFNTRCGGEEHSRNQDLMSKVLEAYFGVKVWKPLKNDNKRVIKHDPLNQKRTYVMFETDSDFEHRTSLFLKHMSRDPCIESRNESAYLWVQDDF
jgi:hypothetical protein